MTDLSTRLAPYVPPPGPVTPASVEVRALCCELAERLCVLLPECGRKEGALWCLELLHITAQKALGAQQAREEA